MAHRVPLVTPLDPQLGLSEFGVVLRDHDPAPRDVAVAAARKPASPGAPRAKRKPARPSQCPVVRRLSSPRAARRRPEPRPPSAAGATPSSPRLRGAGALKAETAGSSAHLDDYSKTGLRSYRPRAVHRVFRERPKSVPQLQSAMRSHRAGLVEAEKAAQKAEHRRLAHERRLAEQRRLEAERQAEADRAISHDPAMWWRNKAVASAEAERLARARQDAEAAEAARLLMLQAQQQQAAETRAQLPKRVAAAQAKLAAELHAVEADEAARWERLRVASSEPEEPPARRYLHKLSQDEDLDKKLERQKTARLMAAQAEAAQEGAEAVAAALAGGGQLT